MADDTAFARFASAFAGLERLRALLPAEAAAFDTIAAALWENRSKTTSIQEVRWGFTRMLLVEGIPYTEVFELASILLARQFGAGKPPAIERSYGAVEATLPPDQKRQRTYRRSNAPCAICESRRLMVEYLLRQGVSPRTVFKEASKQLAGSPLARRRPSETASSEKESAEERVAGRTARKSLRNGLPHYTHILLGNQV
jgi:hypothetical protein